MFEKKYGSLWEGIIGKKQQRGPVREIIKHLETICLNSSGMNLHDALEARTTKATPPDPAYDPTPFFVAGEPDEYALFWLGEFFKDQQFGIRMLYAMNCCFLWEPSLLPAVPPPVRIAASLKRIKAELSKEEPHTFPLRRGRIRIIGLGDATTLRSAAMSKNYPVDYGMMGISPQSGRLDRWTVCIVEEAEDQYVIDFYSHLPIIKATDLIYELEGKRYILDRIEQMEGESIRKIWVDSTASGIPFHPWQLSVHGESAAKLYLAEANT